MFLAFVNRIMLTNDTAAEAIIRGGLFSKQVGTNYIGWVVQLKPADVVHLDACVALVYSWLHATGVHSILPVTIMQRANGFIDPAMIGAGRRRSLQERSREAATCPKKPQILN